MNPNNGGAAFPHAMFSDQNGMSLRDYFAAAALTGVAASCCDARNMELFVDIAKARDQRVPRILALFAYEVADDMLAARIETEK